MTNVEKYRAYINLLSEQTDIRYPENEIFDKSWFFSLGSNEMTATYILDSLANEGRYPVGVADAAAGRIRNKVVKKRRQLDEIKALRRSINLFTKGMALLGAWGEINSMVDYSVSIALTFGFWALVDQTFMYPDEQLIAQGTLIAITMQRSFIPPKDREPLNPQRITTLVLKKKKENAEDLFKTEQWINRLNQLIDSGTTIESIKKVVSKRRYQLPVHSSIEKAEQALLEKISSDLNSLKGLDDTKTVQERENTIIEATRLKRKQLATSIIANP